MAWQLYLGDVMMIVSKTSSLPVGLIPTEMQSIWDGDREAMSRIAIPLHAGSNPARPSKRWHGRFVLFAADCSVIVMELRKANVRTNVD